MHVIVEYFSLHYFFYEKGFICITLVFVFLFEFPFYVESALNNCSCCVLPADRTGHGKPGGVIFNLSLLKNTFLRDTTSIS